MRVLVLNGSPKGDKSNTYRLTSAFLDGLRQTQPVEAETIVAADPDVILTNVNYIDDPVAEIRGRSGWEGMSAVQNEQVFYIDNMASSLSNQNIVKALDQMAKAVYPELFSAE